jgi:hypothetical protein
MKELENYHHKHVDYLLPRSEQDIWKSELKKNVHNININNTLLFFGNY